MISSESEGHKAYLKTLGNDACKYRKSIGLDVCTYSGYCRFKGRLSFSISLGKVPECNRQRVQRMMNLFRK